MLNGSREDQTCQLDALVEGYQDFAILIKEIAFNEFYAGLDSFITWHGFLNVGRTVLFNVRFHGLAKLATGSHRY